jgi:hypothetical protein
MQPATVKNAQGLRISTGLNIAPRKNNSAAFVFDVS